MLGILGNNGKSKDREMDSQTQKLPGTLDGGNTEIKQQNDQILQG